MNASCTSSEELSSDDKPAGKKAAIAVNGRHIYPLVHKVTKLIAHSCTVIFHHLPTTYPHSLPCSLGQPLPHILCLGFLSIVTPASSTFYFSRTWKSKHFARKTIHRAKDESICFGVLAPWFVERRAWRHRPSYRDRRTWRKLLDGRARAGTSAGRHAACSAGAETAPRGRWARLLQQNAALSKEFARNQERGVNQIIGRQVERT